MSYLLVTLALVAFLSHVDAASYDAIEIRVSLIKPESKLAAQAIRNLTIKNEEDKRQLASMATDFISSLKHSRIVLNNVIPSATGEERTEIIKCAQHLSNLANNLQQSLADTSEKLQEVMATTVETINGLILEFQNGFKGPKFSGFPKAQVTKQLEFAQFDVTKLKVRALDFHKTGDEVKEDMTASVARLTKTLKSLNDPQYKEIIHGLFNHLAVLTARAIYRLENWIDVNPDNEDIDAVETAALQLNNLEDRIQRDSIHTLSTDDLKRELINIYSSGVKKVNKMNTVKPNTVGYQEFVRSVMFDGVTIGIAYSDVIDESLKSV